MWKPESAFSSSERFGVNPLPQSLVAHLCYRTFFGPDGRETLGHRDMLTIFGTVVQEVKDEMEMQGRENEFIGSRVLYHPCFLR